MIAYDRIKSQARHKYFRQNAVLYSPDNTLTCSTATTAAAAPAAVKTISFFLDTLKLQKRLLGLYQKNVCVCGGVGGSGKSQNLSGRFSTPSRKAGTVSQYLVDVLLFSRPLVGVVVPAPVLHLPLLHDDHVGANPVQKVLPGRRKRQNERYDNAHKKKKSISPNTHTHTKFIKKMFQTIPLLHRTPPRYPPPSPNKHASSLNKCRRPRLP